MRRFLFPLISLMFIGFLLTFSAVLLLSKQRVQIDLPHARPTFSVATAPKDSLVGQIASVSGVVLWESRTAHTFSPISSPQELLQGEEVDTTASGSAVITFPGVTNVMAKKTTVQVVQTLPANIVFNQTTGSAIYAVDSIETPISLRALDLLITIQKAELTLTVDSTKDLIDLTLASGSATAAYTNTDYVSKILQLQQGDEVVYNNNTKKASIVTK